MSSEFIFTISENGVADDEGMACFVGRCTGEEIVRCKDCKHRRGSCCLYSTLYLKLDGFCSHGKKVTENG